MMHNKGRTESSYLSDINPHTFYSVITIIMMMIEIHKHSYGREGKIYISFNVKHIVFGVTFIVGWCQSTV